MLLLLYIAADVFTKNPTTLLKAASTLLVVSYTLDTFLKIYSCSTNKNEYSQVRTTYSKIAIFYTEKLMKKVDLVFFFTRDRETTHANQLFNVIFCRVLRIVN